MEKDKERLPAAIDSPIGQTNSEEKLVKKKNKKTKKVEEYTSSEDEDQELLDKEPKDKITVKAKQLSGMDRLVTPTEAEVKEHEGTIKNDKPGIDVDIVTMVANKAIANYDQSPNMINLKAAQLSEYKFANVDTSAAAQYGISPFVITTEVPQMFKLVATYNEQQQVNPIDIIAVKFASEGVTDIVKRSIELFNVSTMTVRTVLNDSIANMQILDPNLTTDQSIVLQTLVRAARENPQASVNAIESRIFAAITALLALDDLLVAMPPKITVLEPVRGGSAATSLASMPFYEGMQPHLYYSVFSSLQDWFREYLNETFEECPLQIGDYICNSYQGVKLAQFNKLVIDQYTAGVLRINFQKLRNHAMTDNVLIEKVSACMLKHDKLEIQLLTNTQDFSLLYNWTADEYNLYMFNVMTDVNTQETIVAFLRQELVKTNRLTAVNIESVWRSLSAQDTSSLNFNSAWTASINVGDLETPSEMVIYETFADFFVFNLQFPSIPNSIEAITEVINIHIFMMLYPRITQRMIHTIGFRLKTLYEIMYPAVYRNFRNKYGEVRIDYGRKPFQVNSYEIKANESQQGYIYSIFMPQMRDKEPAKSQNLTPMESTQLTLFVTLLNNLRALVLPPVNVIGLDKKRIAKYPYMNTEYVTHTSWEPMAYADYEPSKITTLGDRLAHLLTYADTMKTLFENQNPSSNQLPRTFNSYYTAWTTQVSKLVSTAGPAYQITCAGLQETLFNSPFYVYSTFNPDPKMYFYVQRSVGIGPLVSANLSAIVVPRKIIVPKFKLNVGTCLAMTIEGEYLRNTITPQTREKDVQSSDRRVRNTITVLDGLALFKMMNSLVSKSRKFGFAMQFTQWLTTPGDIENPLRSLVTEISQYMKMSTWAPLVRRIFTTFGLNFDDYFTNYIGDTAFNVDGRFLDRILVIVDPTTSRAIKNQPLNSMFGQKFTYMVPLDIEKLSILVKPLVSLDSKIMKIKNDWFFGKMYVDELHPTQSDLGTSSWSHSTTINKSFSLTRFKLKGGQATRLEFQDDVTKKMHSMVLPFTKENVPILLINMEYLTELPTIYLDVIAEAISEGKIILRVKYLKIKVTIEDKPTRTINYSEPNWSHQDVLDLLRNPSGCVLDRTFVSTVSATNYQSQALVRPGYIQWLATPTPTDPSLFVSTITNAIERPTQTVVPTANELGYGRGEDGLEFNNGVRKIDSNIINWNNSIPTVQRKPPNIIDVKMIPYIPQYLGVF